MNQLTPAQYQWTRDFCRQPSLTSDPHDATYSVQDGTGSLSVDSGSADASGAQGDTAGSQGSNGGDQPARRNASFHDSNDLGDSSGAGGAPAEAGDKGGARGSDGGKGESTESPSRFAQVVALAQDKFGAAFGSRVKELLSPEAFMWLKVFASAMAIAEATPVGWAVDAVGFGSLVVGACFIGKGLSDAISEFKACVGLTEDPKGDLDEAAQHLATGVSIATVQVFFALLGPPKAGSSPRKPYADPGSGFRQFATPQGLLIEAPEEAFSDAASLSAGEAREPTDASSKVVEASDSQKAQDRVYQINRKNVRNYEKIVGDPESDVLADANREVLAAELAASLSQVDQVYLGKMADAFINESTGQLPSVDVVAISKEGNYYVYECKGGGVTGALTQVERTVGQLGPKVKRATLVLSERITEGGEYSVEDGSLLWQGKPVRLGGGLGVRVVFTTQVVK